MYVEKLCKGSMKLSGWCFGSHSLPPSAENGSMIAQCTYDQVKELGVGVFEDV